jgi:hypothetical protein
MKNHCLSGNSEKLKKILYLTSPFQNGMHLLNIGDRLPIKIRNSPIFKYY